MANINVEGLKKIMRDFYTVTHTRISLMTCDIQEILSFPQRPAPICSLIRNHPALNEKCRQCDNEAFKRCAKSSAPMVYTCHAGLLEVIVPIKENDNILCYVMFGQVVDTEKAEEQRERVYQNLRFSGLDDNDLRDAVSRIESRTMKEISASATILEALTLYCQQRRFIMPGRMNFIERLNAYIDSHLLEPILISDLCNYFYVSRTRLYEISYPYLGCTLATYIQRRRMKHASDLLMNTDLSIADVASATGYCDYNYFRRVFKQTIGISAREYRQAQRGPQQIDE